MSIGSGVPIAIEPGQIVILPRLLMVGFLPFSSPIFRAAGRARELGRVEELALGDDDGAMDAAGADLAARLQAGGNRLEEASGFGASGWQASMTADNSSSVRRTGFDMRAPLLAERGAPD